MTKVLYINKALLVLTLLTLARVILYLYLTTNLFSKNTVTVKNKSQPTKIALFFKHTQTTIAKKVRANLQSPYKELVLGMALGIDELDNVYGFKSALKKAGVIHVVVVSGFNISLVSQTIFNLIGSRYSLVNVVVVVSILLLYALLTGFNPPVIRALLMSVIIILAKFYGMPIKMYELLIFSALVMLIIAPSYLLNLSFQLSFLCTLGLLLYSEPLSKLFRFMPDLLKGDLVTTLSAQALVWPLISYHFGTISIFSPIINALVLWTIPLSTILSFIFILLCLVNFPLIPLCSLVLYAPLKFFTSVVFYSSKFGWSSVSFTLPLSGLVLYYTAACLLVVEHIATSLRVPNAVTNITSH